MRAGATPTGGSDGGGTGRMDHRTPSPMTIRGLHGGDYDAVVGLVADLNAEERYLRFLTPHPMYVGEWALSLTAPSDHVVAIGAFESGELIGVANYVGLPRPGYAEVAVVVAHGQHQRGVGTALLMTLGQIAKESGVNHFVADVLAENQLVRDMLRDAGWPTTQRRDGELLRIEVDLDAAGHIARG